MKKKPTERQLKMIQYMKTAKTKQEAALKAGYSVATARNPRQNILKGLGTREALNQYREYLLEAGISPELLADIEAAGLFVEHDGIRLGYLKEAKKSLGVAVPDAKVQVGIVFSKKDYEY